MYHMIIFLTNRKLQSQEAELQGWLKELNLSSVEDSAGLLIGDELTQVIISILQHWK